MSLHETKQNTFEKIIFPTSYKHEGILNEKLHLQQNPRKKRRIYSFFK